MTIFYYICDFLNTAAQMWLILVLAGRIFGAKRAGKRTYIGQAVMVTFIAGCKVWNNFTYEVLYSNGMLLLMVLWAAIGIRLFYRCSFLDALCLNILIWLGLSLVDFFIQTCVYLLIEKQGGRKDVLLTAGRARGCYLLLGVVLIALVGNLLGRRLAGKRMEWFGYWTGWRGRLFVVMIPMAVCGVYFQRIYVKVISVEILSRWWNFFVGAGLAAMSFLAYRIWRKKEEDGRLGQMKEEILEGRYQDLLRAQEEKAILVHDMRNHVLAVHRMAEAGQIEEILAYTTQITQVLRRGEGRDWTNHEMLDLILNMKFQEAEQAQVKVSCDCDDMSGLKLTSTELCALFSNLLDNAIEANERCPENVERKMDVVCRRHGEMLAVTVVNRFRKEEAGEKKLFGTVKENKKMHGFGMRSIRKVIDSYGGDMKAAAEEDLYTVVVYMRAFEEAKSL